MRLSHCSVLALLAAASLALPSAAQERIGAMGAASPTIEGTPGSGETRVLLIGGEVVQDELISTSPEGSGQVIFLDQTTLSVAPNSEIVLDRYVYDPDRGAGEIGITLTKGALRFIGGRITKQDAATLRTPTATIGIRGGAVLVGVADSGETTVIHVAGEWTRIGEEDTGIDLRRTGSKVVIRGGVPRLDGVATQEEIDAFYRQFEGGGGGLRTTLDPREVEGDLNDLSGFAANERGGARRQPVATSGASPVLRDVITDEPGDYQNTIEPRRFSELPDEPEPEPEPEPEFEFFETETPLPGITGVAVFAPDTAFANGVTRNQLTTPDTVDPLIDVFEGVSGETDGITTFIDRESLNGYRGDGERYVVPVDPFAGGGFDYVDGESPRIPDPAIDGTSTLGPGADFAAAFTQTETSQVFFGRGTPGQLGTAQATDGVERRTYTLRADPYLDSDTPILPPEISDNFGTDAVLSLRLMEEAGAGYFRESGPGGYARGSLATLAIDGSGTDQSSLFVVGTGGVTRLDPGAPAPDIGIYGSWSEAETAPSRIEGEATLLALGDGSTIIGEDGENVLLASASRFLTDDNPDFEAAPVTVDAWEGEAPAPNGFVHVGDLSGSDTILTDDRLTLGRSYEDARNTEGGTDLLTRDDDTAFTGGYVAALGRSRVDGVVTDDAYIVHSGPSGARFSFDSSQNEANAVLDFIGGPSTIDFFDGEEARELGNGVGAEPEITDGTLGFGGTRTRSVMASDDDFLLRDRRSEDLGLVSGSTNINGQQGQARGISNTQQAFRGGLASTGAVGNGGAAVFDTSTDTDHEYLRWGYWSGEFRFAEGRGEGEPRSERFHLGTFVSGNRLDDIDLPSSGTGTFNGFSVVSVSEGGTEYVDGGGFSLSYDFAERTGDARFTDLAGYNFAAAVNGDSFTVTNGGTGEGIDAYAGTVAANAIGTAGDSGFRPAVDGTVGGSFFTDAEGMDVRATAGRIDFQSVGDDGAALRASGIFGGDGTVDFGNDSQL